MRCQLILGADTNSVLIVPLMWLIFVICTIDQGCLYFTNTTQSLSMIVGRASICMLRHPFIYESHVTN